MTFCELRRATFAGQTRTLSILLTDEMTRACTYELPPYMDHIEGIQRFYQN